MRIQTRLIYLLAGAGILFVSTVSADVPSSMNVQGRLADPAGDPAAPGFYLFTFKIFDAEVGGNELWPAGPGEEQTISVDDQGLWNAHVGAVIPLTDAVFDQDSICFLEITVNDGVNPPETLPRIECTASPYAFLAAKTQTVDGATGGTISGQLDVVGDIRLHEHLGFAAPSATPVGAAIHAPDDNAVAVITSGAERLRITSTGNIGIGKNTPTRALDIAGGLLLTDDLGFATVSATPGGTAIHSPLDFTLAFVTSGTERLRITSTGNVGIGRTAPARELDVNGGIRLRDDLNFASASATPVGTAIHAPAGFTLAFVTSSLERLRITSGGDVGIGTDSPNFKLDVRGTIGNNSTQFHSDRRWKREIVTIPNAMAKVQQLRGVKFEWKREEFDDMQFPAGQHIGLVAQEVETVLPELVSTAPDGYKSVAYANLVAVLIEAVKEQQKEIDGLRAIVESLVADRSVPAPESQLGSLD